MKITKGQLRNIIREALLTEGWGQKHGYATEEAPTLEDAMHGAEETLKMAEYRRSRAAEDPDLEAMFLEDAEGLEFIVSQFKDEVQKGAVPGSFSEALRDTVERLDTAVREEIHPELYYAVFPETL